MFLASIPPWFATLIWKGTLLPIEYVPAGASLVKAKSNIPKVTLATS